MGIFTKFASPALGRPPEVGRLSSEAIAVPNPGVEAIPVASYQVPIAVCLDDIAELLTWLRPNCPAYIQTSWQSAPVWRSGFALLRELVTIIQREVVALQFTLGDPPEPCSLS